MRKLNLLALLAVFFISLSAYSQGQSNSQRVQQLPQGHQLRSAFNGLPPQAKAKAENWLNRLNLPKEDFNSIRIDKEGGVFYADSFPAQAGDTESTQNGPSVSESISASEVFILHSKPGAPYTVHLDFDGMTISGRRWNDANGVSTYLARPYDSDGNEGSFSAAERSHIASVWQRVSDDFAPFDIDVTTEEPSSYGPNVGHVLITSDNDQNNVSMPSSGSGGVAYVGIFGSGSNVYYSPALVYYDNSGNEHGNANTTSHEFGHNLGLSHHGGGGDGEYYRGHGSGYTSWSPLMGSSYTKHVTQWDNGSYSGANNTGQDDINKIVSELAYRPDDHGDDTSSATALIIESDGTVNVIHEEIDPLDTSSNNKGVIERRTDLDFFTFSTSGGQATLSITSSYIAYDDDNYRSSNLDIRAKLYNSTGSLINTYSSSNDIEAAISENLSAGTYYLSVEGEGSSSYGDYASLGKYYISGTIGGADGNGGLTTDFAMLGDFGEDDSQATSVANLVNSWDIEFVTTAGDNRYGSINFHQAVGNKYCQWIANPGISCSGSATENKFFPSPGNHDYDDGAGINEYLSYFDLPGNDVPSTNTSGTERYYDFIQDDVHFFMLDSDAAISSSSDRTAQQNWLQTQLAVSTANWKVVILHHAPYSSGNHGSNSTMQWPYAAWGADVVMAGHDHHYERIHKDGIVFIVNGLGGRSLYNVGAPISGSQITYNSNYGALKASVSGNTMNVKFINISGNEIDNYDIVKTVTPPNDGIVDVQISSSGDDTEERASDGSMHPTSTDIELGDDPGFNEEQTVGLLFRNIDIPQGATITSAYLEFEVDEVDTATTDVVIKAQNADNASDFTTGTNNLSTRGTSSASVNWSIPAWNATSEKKQSPDISTIIQEVVSRSGWASGNKIVFIITGTGSRTAESYDGEPGNAAKLHIEYNDDPPANIAPTASFTFGVTDRTVSFTDTSTDSDGTVDAWLWDFGDGNTSALQHPVHNYATDDPFTVTLTVTDNLGATDNASQVVTTCLDSDGDGVCDDDDICAGGDDNVDTDGDGTPDFCDSCNDLIDTDNDGLSDCIDQEINSPCPDNVDANGVSIDSDGDSVPDCLDICPGGDDTIDTDGDGTPDFCDSCNELIDTDSDGINDCEDQEINSPCPANVDANGLSIDSDGDSVPDCLDICQGGDDTVDTDGDGIPNFCDTSVCVANTTNFSPVTLSHSGNGSSNASATIPIDGQDIEFTVSGLNQRTNGKPGNRFNEEITITYVDSNDTTQNYGTFNAGAGSSVVVNISEIVKSITVSLADAYDGNSSTIMSVDLSSIDFCVETITCTDTDGDGVCDENDNEVNSPCPDNVDINGVSIDTDADGVCDDLDICPGSDDNMDTDGDTVPDGCDVCEGSDDLIDTDGDGTPDGCDTCNDLLDTDGDGVNDCNDLEINSLCPNTVDANGVSLDSDSDGVCDEFDVCPGYDDNIDLDVNGIPDGCDTPDCTEVASDGFETGFGNWNDGGNDVARVASNANSGSYSIRLRDNSGNSSSMYTNNMDLTTYSNIRVEFSFYANSMENNEDFMLEVSINGGSSYTTVESWVQGTDFSNNTRYNEVVSVNGPFTSSTVFRIRCDASANNDQIYIDDVVITDCDQAQQDVASAGNVVSPEMAESSAISLDTKIIKVHPNPVSHGKLHVNGHNAETFTYTIVNMLGQTVKKGSSKGEINVNDLQSGMYIIGVQDDITLKYKRFIKR